MQSKFIQVCESVMRSRDWHVLLAKKKGYEQSLLDHSMALVQVGVTLLEQRVLVPSHEQQEQAFLLALAVHDAGKEHEPFQEHLQHNRTSGSPGHTDVALSREIATEIAKQMEWKIPSSVLDAAVSLHMKYRDSSGSHLIELLSDHDDDEWSYVAQWVQDIDRLVSARTPRDAHQAWNRSLVLSKVGKALHHAIRLRGVSSVFVHTAIQRAFEGKHWFPLLFFPTGTLYVEADDGRGEVPHMHDIQEQLVLELQDTMTHDPDGKVQLMCGSIIATYFVKPDLFTLDDMEPLLRVAADGIRELPGSQIADDVILAYANIRAILAQTHNEKLAKKAGQKDPVKLRANIPGDLHGYLTYELEDETKIRYGQRLGEGRKEIAIFKMFKNVMAQFLDNSQLPVLEQVYEERFGTGSLQYLFATTTLMPAVDQALTVDLFWEREAAAFGVESVTKIRDVETHQRRKLLIQTLTDVAHTVFSEVGLERSLHVLVQEMAQEFIEDMEYPVTHPSLAALATQQLQASIVAKTNVAAQKEVPHVCPLCNNHFHTGQLALADYVGKATAFSNRISAYGGQRFMICNTCYYERMLQQVLLGGKPGEFICVIPSVHVPASYSQVLQERLNVFQQQIEDFTEGQQAGKHSMTLAFENSIASNLRRQGDEVQHQSFAELFVFTKSDKRQKEERKKIVEWFEQTYPNQLKLVNGMLAESFASFEEVADALIAGDVYNARFDDAVQEIRSQRPVKTVYQTPNFLLFPTQRSFGLESGIQAEKGEGLTKIAYKQLFLSCLFAEYLNMSVAIVNDLEQVHLLVEGRQGRVYLPEHPRVRKEVAEYRAIHTHAPDPTSSWLTAQEAKVWRKAIQGAILLRDAVGFPERDDISRILAFAEPGDVVRRIQMRATKRFTMFEWEQLEKIKEVLAVIRLRDKGMQEGIDQAAEAFAQYLYLYRPEKLTDSKHSKMGPVGKILKRMRAGIRGDQAMGEAIRLHEMSAKRSFDGRVATLTTDEFKFLTAGISHLTAVLDQISPADHKSAIEAVDSKIYYKLEARKQEYMQDIKQRFTLFLQGKYANLKELSGAWGEPVHQWERLPLPKKGYDRKKNEAIYLDMQAFFAQQSPDAFAEEVDEEELV